MRPDYFDAMKTKIIAGRAFTEADNTPTTTSVIIDDMLAVEDVPGSEPQAVLGKQILAGSRRRRRSFIRSSASRNTSGICRSRCRGAKASSSPTAPSVSARTLGRAHERRSLGVDPPRCASVVTSIDALGPARRS